MEPLQTLPHAELEQRSAELRSKLKDWERAFAAAHNGRKAAREDIKQHPEIAETYKAYDRTRKLLTDPKKPPSSPTKKRSHPQSHESKIPSQTPNKRQRHVHDLHPAHLDPYDPPISLLLSPSQQRACLGPTPQKNGRVLGMFDLLSSGSNSKTPSKRKALGPAVGNALTTPSKRVSPTESKGSRNLETILSSAEKIGGLDAKLTPSTNRINKSCTPSSQQRVSKLRFDDTPAFLRRDGRRSEARKIADPDEDQDAVSWSPIAVRKVPKAAGRGLSTLVQGLREMEDEKLDEELEMLREMEGAGSSAPVKAPILPRVLGEDSQAVEMPLGPDGGESEGDERAWEDEGKGRDGKPLKVWKKKGQKRTTRQVKMKPSVAKWRPEPKWEGGGEEGDGEETNAGATQVPHAQNLSEISREGDSDSDDSGGEDATDGRSAKRRRKSTKHSDGAAGQTTVPPAAAKEKKKISASSHANFRALKIRNKTSKGKKGGRFGGRR